MVNVKLQLKTQTHSFPFYPVCLLPRTKHCTAVGGSGKVWTAGGPTEEHRTSIGGGSALDRSTGAALQKDTSLACMIGYWQDDSWLSLCMASGNGFSCSMPTDSDRPGHLPPPLDKFSSMPDLRSTQGWSQTTLWSCRMWRGCPKGKEKTSPAPHRSSSCPSVAALLPPLRNAHRIVGELITHCSQAHPTSLLSCGNHSGEGAGRGLLPFRLVSQNQSPSKLRARTDQGQSPDDKRQEDSRGGGRGQAGKSEVFISCSPTQPSHR